MESVPNEGLLRVMDALAYKNRQAVSAWEERLWRSQLLGHAVDPRDELGRRAWRDHTQKVIALRPLARRLHRRRSAF